MLPDETRSTGDRNDPGHRGADVTASVVRLTASSDGLAFERSAMGSATFRATLT
jgi:hypothetical protein